MKKLSVLVSVLFALSLIAAGCGSKKEEAGKKEDKKVTEEKEKKDPAPPVEEEEEEEEEEEAPAVEKTPATPAEEPAQAEEKPVPAGEAMDSTVVARVNGVDVDAAEHVERLKRRFQGDFKVAMLRRSVVDRLVNDELIRQEIQKLSIQVDDAELAAEMKLDAAGLAAKKEAEPAKVALYEKKVAERKLLKARGLLKEPSQEELQRLYERESSINLQTVTFPVRPNAGEEAEKASLALAEEVIGKVRKDNIPLQEVVKGMKDGDGRRVIVKPLIVKKGDKRYEDLWGAATGLAENDYSGPLKTRRGYVVFQLVRRRVPEKSFDEMKPELVLRSESMKNGQARHRLLEDLRKTAKIDYLIEFTEPELAPGMMNDPAAGMRPNLGRGPKVSPNLRKLPEGMKVPGAVRRGGAAQAPEATPTTAPEAAPTTTPEATPAPVE